MAGQRPLVLPAGPDAGAATCDSGRQKRSHYGSRPCREDRDGPRQRWKRDRHHGAGSPPGTRPLLSMDAGQGGGGGERARARSHEVPRASGIFTSWVKTPRPDGAGFPDHLHAFGRRRKSGLRNRECHLNLTVPTAPPGGSQQEESRCVVDIPFRAVRLRGCVPGPLLALASTFRTYWGTPA